MTCTKCNLSSDLIVDKRRKGGVGSWCRTCHGRLVENWRLQIQYGITLDEYEQLSENQNNVCLICNSSVGREN